MRAWISARSRATTIWVRLRLTVRAIQQHGHFDFLREVLPAVMPLSMALQDREGREENPELVRLMAASAEAGPSEGAGAATKTRVMRKAPSKPRVEKTPEEPVPPKADLAAARAARRLSRSANADAHEAGESTPAVTNEESTAEAPAEAPAEAAADGATEHTEESIAIE